MKPFLCVILLVLIQDMNAVSNPESSMDTCGIVKYNGYPCESFQLTTDDNYILTIQRIPGSKKSAPAKGKPVVFLQHGLLDSSFTWVNNLPSQSLGYILADLGYDVWLGNVRGNVYSRAHRNISPSSSDFWNFSWDEMATYDLPAMIRHVIDYTGVNKLSYVGHSQGTEIAFSKLSENGYVNSKMSSFVALAPVAYLGNTQTIIRYLSSLSALFNIVNQYTNNGEFAPNSNGIASMKSKLCGDYSNSELCNNIVMVLNEYTTVNLNGSRLSVYLAHVPAGTSSKNINHYAQAYDSKKFQKYDYGFFSNIAHYWRTTPPTIPLNTYNVPVAAFYGGLDKSATKVDVEQTIKELGNCVKFKSFVPTYSHIDFLWGVKAYDLVYKDLIKFIAQYK